MAFQSVFKRYELKYMITREQQAAILSAMQPYMTLDKFGKSTIRNIYFDTDDHILARHSIAKPDFKEKLRIRSYSLATSETTVFVELKRKFDHVVYKRRVALPEHAAMSWAQGFSRCASSVSDHPEMDQMTHEISYFLSYYGSLRPAAFLSYDRTAYRMKEISPEVSIQGGHDHDFRVTFDENILFRDYDMALTSDVYGTPLLEEGRVLMEIKCAGGIPMWMVKVLSEQHAYKTSFSKYGTAYTRCILSEQRKTSTAQYQEPAAAAAVHDSGISETAAPREKHMRRKAPRGEKSSLQNGSRHGRAVSSWFHYLGA